MLYVNKGNSVIHTTPGLHVQVCKSIESHHLILFFNFFFKKYFPCFLHPWILLQIKPEPNTTLSNQSHVTDTNSDNDSFSDDDSPKRRRDLLTRRPSYHRILKDITGPDIAGNHYKCKTIFSFFMLFFCLHLKLFAKKSRQIKIEPFTLYFLLLFFDYYITSVLPASTALIGGVPGNDGLIQTSGAGGTIVQYATQTQDGQFFVPGMCIQFWMDCVFFSKWTQCVHCFSWRSITKTWNTFAKESRSSPRMSPKEEGIHKVPGKPCRRARKSK